MKSKYVIAILRALDARMAQLHCVQDCYYMIIYFQTTFRIIRLKIFYFNTRFVRRRPETSRCRLVSAHRTIYAAVNDGTQRYRHRQRVRFSDISMRFCFITEMQSFIGDHLPPIAAPFSILFLKLAYKNISIKKSKNSFG